MDFKEINDTLRKFSEKHDLVNQARQHCEIAIKDCLEDNPDEGYPIDQVELRFDKQELVFNHLHVTIPFIRTKFGLHRLIDGQTPDDDSENYGYYILWLL